MNSPHRINGRQLMFIITGAQVGTAMLVLPSFLCQEAGQHAWMAIILGAFIPLLSLFLIIKLGQRLPGLNFVQINQALLGKIGGTVGVLLFVVYALCFEIIMITSFAQLVKVYILPNTPPAFTIFLLMVCVIYAGSKGGQLIGRINETLFFGLVLTLFFVIIPTFYSSEITYLLPLGEIDPGELLRASLYTIYTFAGTEVLLVFYSQVSQPEEVWPYSLGGLGLTVATYLIVTIACLLVFGPDLIINDIWPGVTILKVAQIPVVERFEFYFLAIWIGIAVRRGINLTFTAALSLAQLFGTETQYAWFMLGLGAVIYFASLVPSVIAYNLFLWSYMSAAYFFIGVIYPLFLLGMSWIRKGAGKQNDHAKN